MTRSPLDDGLDEVVVQPTDVDRRVIEPGDFVADTSAFVDVRLEGSEGKASYSFIGPGVSQNADQVVNLNEAHGFCIGAASMPSGAVNNPHMHYTAEVFLCTRGEWEMRLGQHGDQRVNIGPNTVFSIPTWIFRGFQNVGDEDSWLFSVLGGDETGGIMWAPQVLTAAADTGMHLTPDHRVIDANAGDPMDDLLAPIDPARLVEFDSYTEAEISERIVASDAGIPATGNLLTLRDFDWWKRGPNDLLIENWVPIDLIDVARQCGVDLMERLAVLVDERKAKGWW